MGLEVSILVDVQGDDDGTVVGQLQRHEAPETAAAAGDDHNLALQTLRAR